MRVFRITKEPIDLAEVRTGLEDPASGAHAIFVGTVRNHHHGAEVTRLEYEAYAPMAEKAFVGLAEDVRGKFGVKACSIIHRVGMLEPGEIAVVVAVSSAHRKEAFEACGYLVDELKRRAPIWKKEWFRDGKIEWPGDERDVELDR